MSLDPYVWQTVIYKILIKSIKYLHRNTTYIKILLNLTVSDLYKFYNLYKILLVKVCASKYWYINKYLLEQTDDKLIIV